MINKNRDVLIVPPWMYKNIISAQEDSPDYGFSSHVCDEPRCYNRAIQFVGGHGGNGEFSEPSQWCKKHKKQLNKI